VKRRGPVQSAIYLAIGLPLTVLGWLALGSSGPNPVASMLLLVGGLSTLIAIHALASNIDSLAHDLRRIADGDTTPDGGSATPPQ
jgi:hypothetical protein